MHRLTYKDTRALMRHSETLRNPSDNPKPLGAAVSTLLGVCASQSSGHDRVKHGREVGRCWGSSPLFLVQAGLHLAAALPGAASAEPQFPAANSPACLEKASGQCSSTSAQHGHTQA